MGETMSRRLSLALSSVVVLALGLAAAGHAVAPVNKTLLGSLAVDGYDPVAYFTEGKPVEGKKEFSTDWNGAKWRFASAANRDLFVAEPAKYAPQYGGYCAWAVANNYTADTDPEAWAVVDGKLYLNYDKKVQEKWRQDVPGNIAKADQNWPKLSAE
jgi:hypothetical protein